MALSSLISLAAAVPQDQVLPAGYITTFDLPDCVQAAGTIERVESDLPLDECVRIQLFASFQGGLVRPCPLGLSPK